MSGFYLELESIWTVLSEKIETGMSGAHFALTVQSSGHSVVRIEGENAADLLAKGCTLDFDHEAMGKVDARRPTSPRREPWSSFVARARCMMLWFDEALPTTCISGCPMAPKSTAALGMPPKVWISERSYAQ